MTIRAAGYSLPSIPISSLGVPRPRFKIRAQAPATVVRPVRAPTTSVRPVRAPVMAVRPVRAPIKVMQPPSPVHPVQPALKVASSSAPATVDDLDQLLADASFEPAELTPRSQDLFDQLVESEC